MSPLPSSGAEIAPHLHTREVLGGRDGSSKRSQVAEGGWVGKARLNLGVPGLRVGGVGKPGRGLAA